MIDSGEHRKGGGNMRAAERRRELLEVLCLRRYDTCENLACEFHVSKRMIYSDIELLTCSYPIETVRGHGGGFKCRWVLPSLQCCLQDP